MRKRVVVLFTALALAFAIVASVGVQAAANRTARAEGGRMMMEKPMRGMKDKMHHMMFARWASQLNLTEEQKAQLTEIHQHFRTEIEPARTEIKAKKAELSELLAAETVDRAAVSQVAHEIAGLHADVKTAGVERLLDASEVLTPEQRAAAAEKIQKMASHCWMTR